MTVSPPHDIGGQVLLRCQECGAGLAYDQRYCVECGARRGPLSPAIAELIGVSGPDRHGSADGAAAALAVAGAGDDGQEAGPLSEIPKSAIAGAVMALLACGVLVGSAVSPVSQSAATAPVIVAVTSSPSGSAQSPAASTPPAAPPAAATPPAAAPEASPLQTASTGAGSTTAPASSPASRAPASTPPASQPSPPSSAPTLPPISHVFLIALSDQGYKAAFGPDSRAPYLAKTLTAQGELLSNYYAVTGGELANEIALVSGQGPTAQTAVNCPSYTDLTPGTLGAGGQIIGSGCVYPRQAQTLGDQLTAAGKSWRAYVADIGAGGPGQATSCRHPTLGGPDPNQAPQPGDPYVTWRDPFVYFHTVIDSSSCASTVVGLEQLAPDLKNASKTPSLAYIVPSRCEDGSEEPCAPGQPSGLPPADAFLRKVVPAIESSPAYKAGGLIAITFDQAPQSGPNADSSGCCITAVYPNLPASATGTSGSSGTSGATTGTSGASGTSTAAPETPGGGQVGLLLISKYVKPGSMNVTGEYNHFSLLASIENLFHLGHLGYAGSPGLLAFDASIFNAASSNSAGG